MEDEALKGRTDCVYFLASPLTCKKGSECEFRHSEMARLNPRDCWYWLNGDCLNPTCAFRHPPVEGCTDTSFETAALPTHASGPTSKSIVPCYFFFNAYCTKGGRCPFMHDSLTLPKFPTPAHEPPKTYLPENKTSTGSETGPASVEVPANPSEGTSEVTKRFTPQGVPKRPAIHSVVEELSPSAESSVPYSEEPAINLPDNPIPPDEYIGDREHICQDQSSEELLKQCVDPDEWWESSPEFDVLVDNGSEQLAYEDDAGFLLPQERESEQIHSHLLPYDFEDSAGYDPSYPDAGFLYDQRAYDQLDHRDTPEYFQSFPGHQRDRIPEQMFDRKRKPVRREHKVGGRDGADLRDHIRKRRRMDVRLDSHSSVKHHSYRDRHSSRERPMRHLPHGRLASEVGMNMIASSLSESESAFGDSIRRRGWSGYPQSSRHVMSRLRERESRRQRHRRHRRVLSSETLRSSSPTEERSTKATNAMFTGPKTLAQIREEKSRAKADGCHSRGSVPQRRGKIHDFEGPKPLSDLLKDKRGAGSRSETMNGPVSMNSEQESIQPVGTEAFRRGSNSYLDEGRPLVNHGTSEKNETGYESDFGNDTEDDEEDGLQEKLALILAK